MKFGIKRLKIIGKFVMDSTKVNLYGGINSTGKSTLLNHISYLSDIDNVDFINVIEHFFTNILSRVIITALDFEKLKKDILGEYIKSPELFDSRINEYNKKINLIFTEEITTGEFFDKSDYFDENKKIKNIFNLNKQEIMMQSYYSQFTNRYIRTLECPLEEINFHSHVVTCEDGRCSFKKTNQPIIKKFIKNDFSASTYDNTEIDTSKTSFMNLEIVEKINNILDSDFDLVSKELYNSKLKRTIKSHNAASGIFIFKYLVNLLLKNELSVYSRIILDEPDSHLHPEWQIKFCQVIKLIASEIKCEFHIATHSSVIIEYLGKEDICSVYHMRLVDDITRIAKVDGKDDINDLLMELGDAYNRI